MKPRGSTWPQYIRRGIGRRLSVLGERLGIPWLIYNPLHFMHFHEHGLENAPGVIATLRQVFPDARRYVDVGAGTGAFAAEARRSGCDVVACEHNAKGRRMAAKQGVDCRPFDLNLTPAADLPKIFDVAYCFEVAEHLPAPLGERLVTFLASLAPVVVFSAAHPGQGGTGHINEQPKHYWIERFQHAGLTYQIAMTEQVAAGFESHKVPGDWLKANVLVFTSVDRDRWLATNRCTSKWALNRAARN